MDPMECASSRWPLPDKPGQYGCREAFLASRHEAGQWVFWDSRAEMILSGCIENVIPFHAEVHVSAACNFSCRWCNAQRFRSGYSQPSLETLTTIVRRLAIHNIGIQWVGGEPLCNPCLCGAMNIAHECGLAQCVFTNGSLLSDTNVEALLACIPKFIRVSLNAVSPDTHRRFHGYAKTSDFCSAVKIGLRRLARAARYLTTRIGVSVVFDGTNAADLPNIAEFLADVFTGHNDAFVVIRHLYEHIPGTVQASSHETKALLAEWQPGGRYYEMLRNQGVEVVTPPSIPLLPTLKPKRLACSFFIEVGPAGEVYLCSDGYGDRDLQIGNLLEQPLESIMASKRRRDILERVISNGCPHPCPPAGRGSIYNSLMAHLLKKLRDDPSRTRGWVADLRATLHHPHHSFFL